MHIRFSGGGRAVRATGRARLRHCLMAGLAASACLIATPAMAAPLNGSEWNSQAAAYERQDGLIPLLTDRAGGRVLAQLPPPGADGVMIRVVHHSIIRDGTGSPATQMDRSKFGPSRILRFVRAGNRVIAQYENNDFTGSASAAEQAGAQQSFALSSVWAGDVIATLADGSAIVDLSGFLTRDSWGMLESLNRAGQGTFRQNAALSMAEPASGRAFADNVELDATFTFDIDNAGREVRAVTPDPRSMTIRLHHSLIRLPDDGYQPRVFDPRVGGFDSQVTDFSAPLGQPLVTRLAHRYRLEKIDPAAARSRVKKPIVLYVDNTAPPLIQQAMIDGASWWKQAFEDMGYIDALQVEVLPEGADPFDARHNMIFWSHLLTRGWSYGHTATDPRTGEILRGAVLIESQRTRQNVIMFEGLLGAAASGTGGPNDPVQLALARLRQLVAHETGHVLGFEHNFASNMQDRSSVTDYPAAAITIRDGALDFTNAYGVGLGEWDRFSAYALYSPDDAATHRRKVDEGFDRLIYRGHPEGRSVDTLASLAAPWVNGTDGVAAMRHTMAVRRIALDRFGLANLPQNVAVHDLRRRIVPVYLYHRYQAQATAKLIAGGDYGYPINGHGQEAQFTPVPADQQRAALAVLLDSLAPAELVLSEDQLKLLAAQTSGVADPQNEIELFASRMTRSFDAGMAAEVAADIVLGAMFEPARINGLIEAAARDPHALTLGEAIDTAFSRVFGASSSSAAEAEAARRVQARLVLMLGRRLHGVTAAPVAGAVPVAPSAPLAPTAAAITSAKLAEWGQKLQHSTARDPVQKAHDLWLAKLLSDDEAMKALLRSGQYDLRIPPGAPI